MSSRSEDVSSLSASPPVGLSAGSEATSKGWGLTTDSDASSKLSDFISENGLLSLSIKKKVVTDIYGVFHKPDMFQLSPSYPCGQVVVAAEFISFPFPLQDPMYSLEQRTREYLKDERVRSFSIVEQAINRLVENNANLYWNGTHHDSYVKKKNVEREMEDCLSREFEMCFYAGAMEGINDGKKVIRHIFGSRTSSSRVYYFAKGSEQPSHEKTSLPVTVMSKRERENLHWREVGTFKAQLEDLESAIEAAVVSRTYDFLSQESGSRGDGGVGEEKIQSIIWETLFTAFKLGKHNYFSNGQFLEKSDLGFDFDQWVYSFVPSGSKESIYIRSGTPGVSKKRKPMVSFVDDIDVIGVMKHQKK